DAETAILTCREAGEMWGQQLAAARATLQQAAEHEQQLRRQDADLRLRSDTANAVIIEMSPHFHAVEEMARLRASIAQLDAELARFAVDLDQQAACLDEDVAKRADVKAWLPWLNQFAQSRCAFRLAR